MHMQLVVNHAHAQVTKEADGSPSVQFKCGLGNTTSSVNVLRFSPLGGCTHMSLCAACCALTNMTQPPCTHELQIDKLP